MAKRGRRTYTEEFKEQMVKLYESGKPKAEIMKKYNLHQLFLILGSKEVKLLTHLRRKKIGLPRKMN